MWAAWWMMTVVKYSLKKNVRVLRGVVGILMTVNVFNYK